MRALRRLRGVSRRTIFFVAILFVGSIIAGLTLSPAGDAPSSAGANESATAPGAQLSDTFSDEESALRNDLRDHVRATNTDERTPPGEDATTTPANIGTDTGETPTDDGANNDSDDDSDDDDADDKEDDE